MNEWEEVKPAKTVTEPLIINVTSSHIVLSTDRGDLFNDPVSRAMKEATNADWCMSGWGYSKCGFPNNIKKSYSLWPQKILLQFFRDWQSKKPVSPITFNASLDSTIDKTPKPSKRKPSANKSYAQLQTELNLK